jgi:hypothetical protein
MEKIKSIEQLRAQKELLKLQQMIAELRMKKEVYELRERASLRNNIIPTIGGLLRSGVTSTVGKQLLFSTATKLVKRVFRRKKTSHAR